MHISRSWLSQYIDIKDISSAEVAQILTSIGLEVESIDRYESIPGGLQGIVCGQILTCARHPNADKLSITTVDVGNGTILPIVCGAPNVATGQKVWVALTGATLYPTQGQPFTIQKSKIRGEVSEGMICAEDEIGIGNGHDGILVLADDTPIGLPAATYYSVQSDDVFEIGLTPNRIDAASHLGVARDLYAALAQQKPNWHGEFQNIRVKIDNKVSEKPIDIKIIDPNGCRRYAGVVIDNIQVKPSPTWLVQKLGAIGLKSINNIVDITNYILHDLGQPLHAFDADKIIGNVIEIKKCDEGIRFVALDGVERTLTGQELMIYDAKGPICMAGIMGGLHSGVEPETTRVFLESAYFTPTYVRKASQQHGLKSDSSFRFERGTDPEMVLPALYKAIQLIQELAAGTIASAMYDFYPNPILPFEFMVHYQKIHALMGYALPKDTIFSILENLEIAVTAELPEGFRVRVPAYRVDVHREADIVEELLRIYGFNQIPVPAHTASSFLAEHATITDHQLRNKIAETMVSNGFFEIVTNTLSPLDYAVGVEANPVKLVNPLSEELGYMRRAIVHSGLEAVAYNLNRKQAQLKFFEFGNVYFAANNQQSTVEGYTQQSKLGIWITGKQTSQSWVKSNQDSSFYELKRTLHLVLKPLRLDYVLIQTSSQVLMRAFEIHIQGKTMGFMGQVHKKVLKMHAIKQTVWYIELNWDSVFQSVKVGYMYKEIAKFPEVKRDLSLVIDKKITFSEIERLAHKTERRLLKNLQLFDIYEGEKIAPDKKAYAISFILQDEQQTLTDTQIDTTMKALILAFEKQLGASIRS